MNWSARGNVLNQYLRNTSIGTTVIEIVVGCSKIIMLLYVNIFSCVG
jgi:hypothetical protein